MGAPEVSHKEVNCKTLLTELCDFLDGGLDPGTMQEIEFHMEHCKDCRVLVDTTRKTIEIFCNAEPIPLPQGVQDRLHRALEQRLETSRG